MTLQEAVDKLVNKYHLEDFIYTIRDSASQGIYGDKDYKGSSWEHPAVKEFSDICTILENWSKRS